jgi:hypothetical protein
MRCRYRQVLHKAGDYADAILYNEFSERVRTHQKPFRPTSEAQEFVNRYHAGMRLARLIHANFTGRDIKLVLTYANAPEDKKRAHRDIVNFFRRVETVRKQRGLPPLKYIYCTEYGSQSGRPHRS